MYFPIIESFIASNTAELFNVGAINDIIANAMYIISNPCKIPYINPPASLNCFINGNCPIASANIFIINNNNFAIINTKIAEPTLIIFIATVSDALSTTSFFVFSNFLSMGVFPCFCHCLKLFHLII